MTDITLPPLPPWAQYPDDDSIKDAIQDYARLAVEQDRERRGEPVAWMYTRQFSGDQCFITLYQADLSTFNADRVWPLYTAPVDRADEIERLRAERDALLELLRCVSTNLKKNMSKSMQELQARTIDAAIKEGT